MVVVWRLMGKMVLLQVLVRWLLLAGFDFDGGSVSDSPLDRSSADGAKDVEVA